MATWVQMWVQIWVKIGSKNWSKMLIWGKLGLSKPESGTFLASQILKVVSNPESGTFWALKT